jgi:hypothetical protein
VVLVLVGIGGGVDSSTGSVALGTTRREELVRTGAGVEEVATGLVVLTTGCAEEWLVEDVQPAVRARTAPAGINTVINRCRVLTGLHCRGT